jgi:uncharacterized protein YqgV (UPF0045/DUF77 family)
MLFPVQRLRRSEIMLASFSISPVGVGEALSKHVAEIVDIIDKSGLEYKLGAMQTTVEGDDAEVVALILQCHGS